MDRPDDGVEDKTPFPDLIFEMEINICSQFPALTPFSLRREKAWEVFLLMKRYSKYGKKKTKPKVIRRPAGDDWF